jgi:hypothetical protein
MGSRPPHHKLPQRKSPTKHTPVASWYSAEEEEEEEEEEEREI